MNKFLFSLCVLFYSFSSWAVSDYRIDNLARSYPLGIALKPEVGYSHALWKVDQVKYGYIRPSLSTQLSGLVNYGTIKVDLFPISFFGFSFEATRGKRSLEKAQNTDCEIISCEGVLSKSSITNKLALAYKNIQLLNLYKIQSISSKINNGLFFEESSSLVGNKVDTLVSNTFFINFNFNETWASGLGNIYNLMRKTNLTTNMTLATLTYKHQNWKFISGLGQFKTRESIRHFSSLFVIQWIGKKGLRLF